MHTTIEILKRHQARLKQCKRCAEMHGPVVVGQAIVSPVLLIGQAPGVKEIQVRKPFAWTAGKTLFKWFAQIGLEEPDFRSRVYMAAVCRCFPGKNPKGGDRVPSPEEVANCAKWLDAEMEVLRPKLILPVGKLAIAQCMPISRLDEVVGTKRRLSIAGHKTDIIALPHPSGASVWHRTEPGKTLLARALGLVRKHPAWQQLLKLES